MRAKEFLSTSSVAFEALNVGQDEGARQRLERHGLSSVPVVCVGARCVSAVSLADVAELVGVAYEPRPMLPPAVLRRRMLRVIDVATAFLDELPPGGLEHRHPDRDRTIRDLTYHVFRLNLAFVEAYDSGRLSGSMLGGEGAPETAQTANGLAACGRDVRDALAAWWERAGAHDPLDRIIETYHGIRTLHEAMEREAWHGAQHTRQLAMLLGDLGVAPADPLRDEDLAGLPLPAGVWD